MRKLHWLKAEGEAKEAISKLNNKSKIKQLPGLFLRVEQDNGERGTVFVCHQIVSVFETEKQHKKGTRIIFGEDSLKELHSKKRDELQEEYPEVAFTDEGEEVISLDVKYLQVLPLYDGQLDPDLDEWELFEEAGYIYGKDKRTGNIYELKHLYLSLTSPFKTDTTEVWYISNQEKDDIEKVFGQSVFPPQCLGELGKEIVESFKTVREDFINPSFQRFNVLEVDVCAERVVLK